MTTVEIAVENLKIGMYVSELDRPWLGTPYAIQGIFIQSQKDIDKLLRHCTYVYVDTEKSESFVAKQFFSGSQPANIVKSSSSGGQRSSAQPRTSIVNKRNTKALRMQAQELQDVGTLKTQFHGPEIYTDKCTAKEELPAATQAFEMTEALFGEISAGIERGTKLDVHAAQETVDALRDSVVRNADAALLLAKLKTKGQKLYDSAVFVSVHLLALGRHLGLPSNELSALGLGGLLMDVGKLRLPSEIQTKDGSLLSGAERALMRQHVTYGEEIVAQSADIPEAVFEIVKQHHERENGSGYPRNTCANQLNPFSRMAAIVDCYEELIKTDVNLPATRPYDALRELKDSAYRGLNSALVEQFAQCIGIFPVGSLVELNTGEVAIVLTHNRTQRFSPSIMIIYDGKKQPYDEPRTLDLRKAGPAPNGALYAIVSDLPQDAYGIDAKQYYL